MLRFTNHFTTSVNIYIYHACYNIITLWWALANQNLAAGIVRLAMAPLMKHFTWLVRYKIPLLAHSHFLWNYLYIYRECFHPQLPFILCSIDWIINIDLFLSICPILLICMAIYLKCAHFSFSHSMVACNSIPLLVKLVFSFFYKKEKRRRNALGCDWSAEWPPAHPLWRLKWLSPSESYTRSCFLLCWLGWVIDGIQPSWWFVYLSYIYPNHWL